MSELIKREDKKFYSMLGLAQKAGKVKSGSEAVLREFKKKSLKAVIMSSDISENTAQKFTSRCEAGNVPVIYAGTAQELGKAIGKDERSVVGICDAGFARALNK